MSRHAIPGWFFVVVVVRRGDEFLVVHERKHGGGWYLPAGRVEKGEPLVDAARRETLEESGLVVELDGVLRVEHTPLPDAVRLRVFFAATARAGAQPRATPNEHTLEARFATLEELRAMPLRGREVIDACAALAGGAPIHPLSILTFEGAPWR